MREVGSLEGSFSKPVGGDDDDDDDDDCDDDDDNDGDGDGDGDDDDDNSHPPHVIRSQASELSPAGLVVVVWQQPAPQQQHHQQINLRNTHLISVTRHITSPPSSSPVQGAHAPPPAPANARGSGEFQLIFKVQQSP